MVRYLSARLEKMMREASNDSRDAIEIIQNMERSSSVRDEDYVGILTCTL